MTTMFQDDAAAADDDDYERCCWRFDDLAVLPFLVIVIISYIKSENMIIIE